MIVSGFDLATRLCGWCSGDGNSLPTADAWEFGGVGDDLGKLLDLFDRALEAHIERFEPQAIIYEKPILVVGKGRPGDHTDDPLVLRKIYGLGGHLEFVGRRRGIPCHEVTLQDIKREITGNPMSKKPPMVAIARRIGLQLPKRGEEDATDAFGAWKLGISSYAPEIGRKWDRIIHSPHGKFVA